MAGRRPSKRHRSSPDDLAKAIGVRIRSLRTEKAWTFDAFVEETGLGRGYVSELERGLVVPSVAALHKVATALEVTLADLVLGNSPRERLYELTRHVNASDLEALTAKATAAKRAR